MNKWFLKQSRFIKTLIYVCSFLLFLFSATLISEDEEPKTFDYFFSLLGLLSLYLPAVFIFWQVKNNKLKKKELNARQLEEKQKNDIHNSQKYKTYQELISNDFTFNDNTSNFKTNIMITCIRQILQNSYFNPNDIDFDPAIKLTELQQHAEVKMKQSNCGSFVALDTETTGLSIMTDRIIQIAAVKVINYEIVDVFSYYINPQKRISAGATEIHNITNDMLKNEPTIKDIFPELEVFIGDLPLVMHNARFDYSILKNEYLRVMKKTFEHKYICTMILWRREYKEHMNEDVPSATLNSIVNTLLSPIQIKEFNKSHHDAINDAKYTAFIYMKMI